MKWKIIMIAFVIALSSSLFMGCSNAQNHSSKAAVTNKKNGKSRHHQKKNTKIDPQLYSFLGISKKDFRDEKKAGKSIVEIAKEKNKTEQQVIDFLVNNREHAFKKKNPNITENQLNEKKLQWTKKIQSQIEKTKNPKKGE